MSAEHLFSPFQLGDLTLANRMVMAPLTRARSNEDRTANPLMAQYYQQRASAGLLISEATVVSQQGIGWDRTPGIYNDQQLESWKQVTDAVHQQSGKIFLQLWHTGRASHSYYQVDGQKPVAPSAIAIQGEGVHSPKGKLPHEVPRALETEELPGIVSDYRLAARRAWQAGFDGVEIHSANGYLLDEFLQSKTNHRTDAYGGSIQNRYRLLREVTEAVLEELPSSRVAVRLSPNGVFGDMGSPDYREQFLYVAQQLNQYGLSYLHVVDGLGFGFHELGEPVTLKEMREVFSGPLMGNCGYDRETAEAAIADGQADLIAFGRPFISNPDLVERFAQAAPLNPDRDPSTWYSHDADGYTDYPTLEQVAQTQGS